MKPVAAHGLNNVLRHAAAAQGDAVQKAAPAIPAFAHFQSDLKTLAEKFLGNRAA